MKFLFLTCLFGLIASFTDFALAQTSPVVTVIKVTDNGFEPSTIKVPSGSDVVLRITRTSDLTCATVIQIPSKKIKRELPLNKTVEIDIGRLAKGELKFGCAMNMMISGVISAE